MVDIRFYCDDGYKHDLRVAELLKKYGFKGYFYIPVFKTELTTGELKKLSEDHIICGHTLTHCFLTEAPLETAEREIIECKIELETILEKECEYFAPPKGWYNSTIIDLVKKAGFKEMRTMKQNVFSLENYSKFEIPITIHFHPLYYKNWKEYFEKSLSLENGYFGCTCHGWELNRYNLWEEYEEMLKYISNKIKGDENKNN